MGADNIRAARYIMPRLICIDTYYPQFVASLNISQSAEYESELRRVLSMQFGTADFVTKALNVQGWTTTDVIANCEPLQRLWARAKTHCAFGNLKAIALEQIEAFKPDVVFLQDVSFFDAATLKKLADQYLLAAQISCPMKTQSCMRSLCHLEQNEKCSRHPDESWETSRSICSID